MVAGRAVERAVERAAAMAVERVEEEKGVAMAEAERVAAISK